MHSSIPAAVLLLAAASHATAQSASPQVSPAPPPSQFTLQYVQLQPTTPGTAQSGNANVTGSLIAGSVAGNGASLTNLNATQVASGTLADARLSSNVARLSAGQTFGGANTFSSGVLFNAAGAAFSVANSTKINNLNCDKLDGLDSSAFLQSIPVPLILASTTGIAIEGSSSVDLTPGVYGSSTATNFGYAVQGFCNIGAGTYGEVGSGVGAYGTAVVSGVSVKGDSALGDGVYGIAYGLGHGVHGYSNSSDSAVYGRNDAGGEVWKAKPRREATA